MSASSCRLTASRLCCRAGPRRRVQRGGPPLAASPPGGVTALPATPAPAAPAGTRSVDYRGVHLSVPSDWPVVDLDADPTRCVRLDIGPSTWADPAASRTAPRTASGGPTRSGCTRAPTGSNRVHRDHLERDDRSARSGPTPATDRSPAPRSRGSRHRTSRSTPRGARRVDGRRRPRHRDQSATSSSTTSAPTSPATKAGTLRRPPSGT